MANFIKRISRLKSIYRGDFVDIDLENKLAYERYPFPIPTEKQYDEYDLKDIKQHREGSDQGFKEQMADFGLDLSYFKDKVVVDLGSGVGWDAICLADNGAKAVHAVDDAERSIEHGKMLCFKLGINNVKFHKCSLYNIHKLDITPDIIIARGVLHHVFDLPKFAKSLREISTPQTEMFFTHSSYWTKLCFYKYFNNHLAWALGGSDLEARIDIGIKLFKRWTKDVPDKIIRQRTNDLSGVFYMARSKKSIRRIFEQEGFSLEFVPCKRFSHFYSKINNKISNMQGKEGQSTSQKLKKSILGTLFKSVNFLCTHSKFMDRVLGYIFIFFFIMPPYLFKVKYQNSRISNHNKKTDEHTFSINLL